MLRVSRNALPQEAEAELNRLHAFLSAETTSDKQWKEFQKTETYRTVRQVLETMFHGKCAYCEAAGATHIEHHWPKSPHSHNSHRGSPTRMFRWDNFILACSQCNVECKGSHMNWDEAGNPLLLNPCHPEDDPLCYFTIQLHSESEPAFTLGWIDPQPNLSPSANQKAEYTLRRLKLNQRDYLVAGRARTLKHFFRLIHFLQEFGPDYEAPEGHTLRVSLIELLIASEPHLAPIRQVLYAQPEIRQQLLESVPELEAILNSWALPPTNDCVHVAAIESRRTVPETHSPTGT